MFKVRVTKLVRVGQSDIANHIKGSLDKTTFISVDPLLDLVLQVLEFVVFSKRVVAMEQYQKIVLTSQVHQDQLGQVALLQYVR